MIAWSQDSLSNILTVHAIDPRPATVGQSRLTSRRIPTPQRHNPRGVRNVSLTKNSRGKRSFASESRSWFHIKANTEISSDAEAVEKNNTSFHR